MHFLPAFYKGFSLSWCGIVGLESSFSRNQVVDVRPQLWQRRPRSLAANNLNRLRSDTPDLDLVFHRPSLLVRSPGLRPRLTFALEIERHCSADEILQGRLIDLVAFVDVDGAPDIPFEAGVE